VPVNHVLAELALQNRLAGVTVVTTGTMTLAATATGYTRAAGSFLTDGFAAGMEVTPVGFTTTTRQMVTKVEALTLTTGAHTVDSAAGSRSLAVGLPEIRAWENIGVTPIAGRPYVEADYVPATAQLLTAPSAGGVVEETGLYVTRLYGVANTGFLALAKYAGAILALFPPGATLNLSDGSALRYRENPGPFRGSARADTPGFAVVTITVPWRSYTTN
jgi:uncharacterized protein DUF4128